MPVRISLTMIVRNEAKALPQCLEAARPWVDEIVVVDTGSTDGTQDIAREYGARVSEWAWRDDFAAARNESLRHASGDWVLALDADETLTPESGPALRHACEAAPDDVVGYEIKIVCPHSGNGGFTRLNWFPRLFRNLPGVQWEGIIHEQVVASLIGRGGRIDRASVAADHSGYTLPQAEMELKAVRNITLLERQLHDEPDHAPGWFQLAETYAVAGRVDEAVNAYRKCLRLLFLSRLTLSSSTVALAMNNLGSVLLNHRDAAEGRQLIQDALLIDPNLVPAHVHLGNHALRERRWDEAEGHFNTALDVQRRIQSAEFEISPWLVYRLRGQARMHRGMLSEALADFEQALGLNPGDTDALKLISMAAAQAGQWQRSLDALEQVQAKGEDNEALHVHRVMALTSLQRFAEAAEACRDALGHNPDSLPVLALLAENLARAGRPAEAAQAYERITEQLSHEPGPWLALAQCRETLGDRPGMLAAYRRAAELAPESVDVNFALGSACLRAGLFEAAEACLATAAAGDPNRADVRLNHALCLLKKGALAEAATALTAMLERWPDLAQVRELHRLVSRLSARALSPALAGGGS